MKCDVCGTKIPLGSRECPNCGYKYGTSHVNTYDASGEDHDHIQVKPKNVRYQSKSSKQVNNRKQYKSSQILVRFFVICSVLYVFYGIISSNIELSNKEKIYNEEMTIQSAIDEGHDDGTLEMALEYEEELIDFADNILELEDIMVNEYVSTNYGVYASVSVSGYEGEGHYNIDATFNEATLASVSLTIYNSDQESMRTSNTLEKEKDLIEKFGSHYHQEQLFDRVLLASHQLVEDESDKERWIYNNKEDRSLYISEKYEDYSELYGYYIRIDIEGE